MKSINNKYIIKIFIFILINLYLIEMRNIKYN